MNTQPTNINTAIAQANRLSRAQALLTEGYTFTQDAVTEMVAVCKPGELGAAYWIGEHMDGRTGCDCPDALKGNKCKHELAWKLIKDAQDKAEDEAMWEAICAEHDEREKEEGGAAFSRPTEAQLLESLLSQVRADIAKHEQWIEAVRHEPFSLTGMLKTDSLLTKLQRLKATEEILQGYAGKMECGVMELAA